MRKALAFLLYFFSSQIGFAQSFLAGLHFNGSTSVGKLKEEVGSVFFPSLSGFMLYEFEQAPIQLGLELGYGVYGSKLEKRTDLYPGTINEVRLRRNNNLITSMATIRYLPLINTKYTPFIEAQFGINYLYTRYKIRATILDDEPIEVATDHKVWTIAYRIGAGIQFPLDVADKNVKLEFKTSYQDSNSIQFLTKGDVTYLPDQGNGEFQYNFRRGPLQLITGSVGIVIYDAFR